MRNFPQGLSVFPHRPTAVIRAHGPDAATFLQGQFTNDLSKLSHAEPAYGLWLDRKGHVIADSHVIRSTDGKEFWIVSLSSPASAILAHLEAHIIADDVTLEDATSAWRGIALVGIGAAAWLTTDFRAGYFFPGRRAAVENWEWIVPEPQAKVAEEAVAGAPVLKAAEIERMRIESGIPSIPRDIGPGELPQEGGLETQAISYSKGCYIGQEVMARLKSRGRVRRRLAVVSMDEAPPSLPCDLWLGARKEGELRTAARASEGKGYVGLALVSSSGAHRGGFALGPGGPSLVGIVRED